MVRRDAAAVDRIVAYEMTGVDKETAVQALTLAASKLPLKTKLLIRGLDPWA